MTISPCAKVNIGLYVTARRPDGYHNLETILYPIPLYDELQVETNTKDQLEVKGIPIIGEVEDNLIMKVVYLLRNEGHRIPPLSITLDKRIPTGAGLGGGSSDAASMMKLLNDMFNLRLSTQEMESKISKIGADCAFFINSQPAFAEGIGDILTPIDMEKLHGYYIELIKPDDFVSTKEAYAHIRPKINDFALRESVALDISDWRTHIKNDFETSIFPQHPTIKRIKDDLYNAGALYAAMSGSGSSVFGIFDKRPDIKTPYYHFSSIL